MTEKLYFKDAYIKEFTAKVLSVSERGGKFAVVLDKTAFFPEEAGQSADRGCIGEISVVAVYENGGVIEHVTESPINVGESVLCRLDFSERFEKMQNHTAEHIVSGLIHKLFGLDNVGFHLGREEVTIDVNGVLERADLDRVETLANQAVFENVEVVSSFPSPEKLSEIEYRSKLDLTENVRIVTVGEYDTCACCAPHVARTGEIGLIKLLDFMKHRGGTRIRMLAGSRALLDYRDKFKNIQEISAMLSLPQSESAEGLRAYMSAAMQTEYKLKNALLKIIELEADRIEPTDKNLVVFLKDLSLDEARELVNKALHKVSGVLVALVGEENNYKYVMASEKLDMREVVKAANAALSGKGGGKPPMMQGSFCSTLSDINEYFAK